MKYEAMPFEQKTTTESPELAEARAFLGDSLPLADTDAAKKLSPRELFLTYREFMNGKASFEHFAAVASAGASLEKKAELANRPKEELLKEPFYEELWQKYLSEKLPKEIIRRQMELHSARSIDELPASVLETVHARREALGHQLILGFHVSDLQIVNEVLPGKRATELLNEEGRQEISAGKTYYSTDPEKLYKQHYKYLILIEGDAHEVHEEEKTRGTGHGGGAWVATARKLPVLKTFKLTNELIETLGLKKLQ